jgi:hypothetical protein
MNNGSIFFHSTARVFDPIGIESPSTDDQRPGAQPPQVSQEAVSAARDGAAGGVRPPLGQGLYLERAVELKRWIKTSCPRR